MPRWIRFLERKPNGKISEALGSDSLIPITSYSRHSTHARALAYAKSLRGVGKRYLGYCYLSGPSLLRAVETSEVRFTDAELEQLERD